MQKDLACPICDADLPLNGDERVGEEIFCTFCGAPCRLTKVPSAPEESFEVEEDF
jgi:hypothetical protein